MTQRRPRVRGKTRCHAILSQGDPIHIRPRPDLLFSVADRTSERLTRQLEIVLSAIDVLALEAPTDALYGELRAQLERTGRPIGANDLLIAAHALALAHTVV